MNFYYKKFNELNKTMYLVDEDKEDKNLKIFYFCFPFFFSVLESISIINIHTIKHYIKCVCSRVYVNITANLKKIFLVL